MDRHLVRVVLLAIAVSLPCRAWAQTVEAPVPFDSSARVMAVTPALAERLRLRAPEWPVAGDYREARLYAVQPGGGFVLVVHRAAGTLERTTLTAAQRETLRGVVESGMNASGHPSGETGSAVISEPAGFAFARDQGLLGLNLYGPLAASLADDGTTAGSAYLLVAGGAFFVSYGLTQSQQISRAQSDLAEHLAYDFAGEGALWTYALNGDTSKATRAVTLAAAITGSVAGLSLGRTMSDAESHAASAGITATALTTWGVASAAGATGRTAAALVGAGGVIGYGLGLAYPRHASYTVTAGDVNGVYTSGLIGAGVGAMLVADGHVSSTTAGLVVTPAYLAGLWVGDRVIARRYDLTAAQGRLLQVGAGAGALMGAAVPMLAQASDTAVGIGFATLGAALGSAITLSLMQPRPAGAPAIEDGGSRFGNASERKNGARRNGVRMNIAPSALGALSGIPGRYPVLQLSF